MNFLPRRTSLATALAVLLPLLLLAPASAQNLVPLGSSYSVTAEPMVVRPATQPVVVPLFQDFTFKDYASRPFAYAPPAGPGKRWSKIILVGDFAVSAGRQFDRSAEISIGHTNVYFGTTAEPSDNVSPAWHVERDLTDDAALFRVAHSGEITLGNTVDSKYTGVIHGTASLLFYPVARRAAPPIVPDLVLPLPASGTNGIGSADTPAQTVSATYALPTNTVRAYLDLMTESQGDDEFWYLNVPNNLTATLKTGGGTAFREAEVTVDGRPAGAAPIFPWIYTGGLDPALWRPIPGVQTLNFVPYRVNLTPFVGIFNDGKPHTVGVRIVNNQNHFQIAGTLLIFRDPVLKTVRGALTLDTLTANPIPVVQSHITQIKGDTSGPVSVTSRRHFMIAGYVLTSSGKIRTKITQTVGFSSTQQFETSAAKDSQSVQQTTTVSSVTETQTPSALFSRQDEFQYPLMVRFSHETHPDGSASQTTEITQINLVSHDTRRNGLSLFSSALADIVHPNDVLELNAAGKVTQRSQNSFQFYECSDSLGTHYSHTLTAANGVVTSDSPTGTLH